MKKINNKGFTLIEVLAVIAIIAIIGIIAVPNVLNSINTGKQATYNILVEDITIAGIQLFEEIEFTGNKLYNYDTDGNYDGLIKIDNNKINVDLQTLVSNGFLSGTNNPNKEGANKNNKIITNPKTKEDIGTCQITITKIVDANFNTSYQFTNTSTNTNCPTDNEYQEVLN